MQIYFCVKCQAKKQLFERCPNALYRLENDNEVWYKYMLEQDDVPRAMMKLSDIFAHFFCIFPIRAGNFEYFDDTWQDSNEYIQQTISW